MTALSDRFFAEVARLGQRRRTNPEHYVTVWALESGMNPAAINPKSGARGLNQMMPSTLRGLGAPADFETLSGEEQLPWIERLIADGERLNGGPFQSAARYYHSNFYPATMARGSAPATVVVARDAADPRERAAYDANKGLDFNHDGAITLADLAALLEHVRATKCPEAFARLDRAVRALHTNATSSGSSTGPLLFGVGLAVGAVALTMMRGVT